MAKNNPTTDNRTRKTFKAEMPPMAKLEEGDVVRGLFQSVKNITIEDQNTGEPKEVRQYTFKTVDSGSKFVILGRTNLDATFDEVLEAIPVEKLVGKELEIMRGEDSKLSRKRTLGNYEIAVLD